MSLVRCPCLSCQGKKVTTYVRRQHSRRYTLANTKPRSRSGAVKSGPTDHQQSQSVLEPSHHEPGLLSSTLSTELTGEEHVSSQSMSVPEPELFKALHQQTQSVLEPSHHEPELLSSTLSTELTEEEHVSSQFMSVSDLEPELEPSTCSDLSPEGFCAIAHYDMTVYESDICTKPLYKHSEATLLQALIEHFSWFSEHPGISKTALSDLFYAQHNRILPPGNVLPDSFDGALKLLEPFLVKTLVLHCCPNDCVIYRGDYAELDKCPMCGTERYTRNRIPAKQFTYLPIGPRFMRMFGTSNLAQILQEHLSMSSTDMYDIHDSPSWRNTYDENGIFGGDRRGISLALCTDGVNPFKHNNVAYSMWPIVLTILNLPREIRQRFSNLLLVGIIPGPSEPSTLNSYLEVVVDEILTLVNMKMYDAYSKAPFNFKVTLLLHVLDYPGVSKLFHTMASGAYQGCMWCDVEGTWNEDLHKIIYVQNRRFLPLNSDLRLDTAGFPIQSPEMRPPPQRREYEKLKAVHHAYDKAKNKTQAKAIAKQTGCKGTYPLMKLPFHDRVSQTVPDAMHTIKDAVVHVFNVIIGKEDSEKTRKAELRIGRFEMDEPGTKKTKRSSRSIQTVPCYCISSEEIDVANARSLSVTMPSSDFTPGAIFTKATGLKSHDWKELICAGILKYCLRGMLGKQQRQSLFYFLDTLTLCCSECVKRCQIEEIKQQMHLALSLIERDFPMNIQVITMHLLHHIPEGIATYGPVYGTWMFPYERFNSWICRRALNRFRPEATIMETYRIYEWCQYMAVSGCISAASEPADELQCHKLSEKELGLLNELYLKLIPLHKHLSDEYEKALKRAANARRRSQFPSKECWTPPFQIGEIEKELLSGPQPEVTAYKRRVVQHEKTKRNITFTSAEYEPSQSRHKCSYVQFRRSELSPVPILGRIRQLFGHKFGGTRYMMAVVDKFRHPQQDDDSGLWWVHYSDFDMVITELSDLLSPRVIALEDNKLWFLNIEQ